MHRAQADSGQQSVHPYSYADSVPTKDSCGSSGLVLNDSTECAVLSSGTSRVRVCANWGARCAADHACLAKGPRDRRQPGRIGPLRLLLQIQTPGGPGVWGTAGFRQPRIARGRCGAESSAHNADRHGVGLSVTDARRDRDADVAACAGQSTGHHAGVVGRVGAFVARSAFRDVAACALIDGHR